MSKPLMNPVAVRLAPALHRTFTAKAAKFGGLLYLFCLGPYPRLTIQQPTTEGTIYHVSGK